MIAFMFLLRLIPVLSLAMVIWTGAVAGAYVQGPQRQADGSFVICSGTGTTIVSVTIDGEEQSVTMPCSNCLAHVWAGEPTPFETPCAPQTFAGYMPAAVLAAENPQQSCVPQLARAPPLFV